MELIPSISPMIPGMVRRGASASDNGADARPCATIMEENPCRGEPLEDHLADAFVAAMAVRLGSRVVTRNTGWKFVDPWSETRLL